MKLIPISVIAFLCFFNIGCKKTGSENQSTGEPVKRPAGNAIGQPIVKTIGEAGGTIENADKSFKVIVPQGAVTAATEFSVQLVENTLTESSRPAYRLLPEGLAFKNPVTIVFSYKDEDLTYSAPELLRLAYQKSDGIFYMAMETVLDKTAETISVQSTHFSDWTFAEEIKVEVDKSEVEPGKTANLKVMRLESLLAPLVKDAPLGSWVDFDVKSQISRIKWSLATGAGKLSPSGINCTYTAPGEVPATNPALITVKVPFYNSTKKDYSSEVILTVPIAVVEDEYFIVTLDGAQTVNDASGDCTTPSCINMEADNFYVNATLKTGDHILIRLLGDSFGARSYPYGLEDNQAYLVLTGTEEFDWWSHKIPCPGCDELHSEGGVKITRYDTNIGGYVEGNFSGEVWLQNGSYNPPKKTISGKFRAKRTI